LPPPDATRRLRRLQPQADAVSQPTLSPADIARHYQCGISKVLGWIGDRQLRAIDIGRGQVKPRWRVRIEDLDAFEVRRSRAPAPRRRASRRQASVPANEGIKFFPEG
jgi:hypothetical protein